MDFQGERVAVVGLGKSNLPLIRFLLRNGAQVTACDRQTPPDLGERYQELVRLGVNDFALGPGYLDRLSSFRRVYLTPGIPKHLPEIAAARAVGAVLSGEIDLVLQLCPAPVIGITGSAGKTTTTTLVGEVLLASGQEVLVGGNIGNPLIEQVEKIPTSARVVLELSSFQLHLATRSPQVAVITNVSPNHLDIHASMDEYVDAKRNIFRHQGEGGRVVLNADNPVTRAMAAEIGARAVLFSRTGDPGGAWAAFVQDDTVYWRMPPHHLVPVLALSEIRLLGAHNVENVLATVAAAFLGGGSLHGIRSVITTFTGVEHRLEPVRELHGVRYYNDSKATAPVETMAALAALPGPAVLIAGGYDKKIPFDDLAAAVARSAVHTVILTGPTAAAITSALAAAGARVAVVQVADMVAAVGEARCLARSGDTVLLSPACASYDQYRNFEERGRHFKGLVQALS